MNNDDVGLHNEQEPPGGGGQQVPGLETAFEYLFNTLFGRAEQVAPAPNDSRDHEDSNVSDMSPVDPLPSLTSI